jgi:hypothetical protein
LDADEQEDGGDRRGGQDQAHAPTAQQDDHRIHAKGIGVARIPIDRRRGEWDVRAEIEP